MTEYPLQWKQMTVGVCYYPEHWPREMWETDLARMKAAGISVVRVGEFAWNLVEPEEGVFRFDFFGDFLSLCAEKDMRVILGTPTATPPAWLTEKYPEVLNVTRDGVTYRHGARRHYNYNSPKYRELCARIVEQLAVHYAGHPMVVGWQIDNELNCGVDEFHSEADQAAFRAFLRDKYGTLEALNRAWGAVFWNQTYTDWAQVYPPRRVPMDGYNPHQMLDYSRFVSESAIRFCRMQADILLKYAKPGDFITTNGMFGNLDNARMTRECLDVYTYDSYPSFGEAQSGDASANEFRDRESSRYLTDVRGICPHFGIMEQESGMTLLPAPAPKPGQLELWATQSVAQGADFVSFFRWRTCPFGAEYYWHGILDYDSRDNRKLREVSAFCEHMRALDPVCGAKSAAAFAVVKDFDNACDARLDSWHAKVQAFSEREIFAASQYGHAPYDTVWLDGETPLAALTAYPVLIYPHPFIIDPQRVELLEAYVRQGGTLIVGCRAGLKDMDGHCVTRPLPGLLSGLTGTDIREFTFEDAREPFTALWNGEVVRMPVFDEILTPAEGTQVLARYASNGYAGEAAVTERPLGRGRTIHVGGAFGRDLVKKLLAHAGVCEPFRDIVEAPEAVEIVLREKDGRRFLFCLNYQATKQEVRLKATATSLYDGKCLTGRVVLPPYGTAVFEIEN